MGTCEMLDVKKTSKKLGISVSTLEKMRANGSGPDYFRSPDMRRILYPLDAIKNWD